MLAHVYGASTWQNDAIKHQNLLPTPQSANFPHATAIDWGYQWIGLRENLQETIDFPIKYGAFL